MLAERVHYVVIQRGVSRVDIYKSSLFVRINAFLALRQRASRWVQGNTIALTHADLSIPDTLNYRSKGDDRSIYAIASVVGGR